MSVTASPVEVRWTFDGQEYVCSSAGADYSEERYRTAIEADGFADDGEICTYLFTDASHVTGADTAGTVATVWDYSWSINGAEQGVFNAGVESPPTQFDLTIREIQAVVTND